MSNALAKQIIWCSLQEAAGYVIGVAPMVPVQVGHLCSEVQSIMVKPGMFFITLRINYKEKVGSPELLRNGRHRSPTKTQTDSGGGGGAILIFLVDSLPF